MRKRLLSIGLVFALLVGMAAITAFATPSNWVDVSNWKQLSAVLKDTATTGIRLTADIQIPRCGVAINPNKAELFIDGNGFTLHDYASNSCCDSIRLEKRGALQFIQISNLKFNGKNYYGVPYIDPCLRGITVRYENVTYVGPQLVYNRSGTVQIKDSTINLVPGYCNSTGEVAEANFVLLEGNVTIDKNQPKSCEEIFWLTGPDSRGGLRVAAGAKVFVTNNKGLVNGSGFYYNSLCDGYLVFDEGSEFSYAGKNVFLQCCALDKFAVGKNASVVIDCAGDIYCSNDIIEVEGTVTIDEGATLIAVAPTNRTDECILELEDGCKFNVNNPKYVLLFNGNNKCSGNAIDVDCDPSRFDIKAGSIRYWDSSIGQTWTNLVNPTVTFANPNGLNYTVTGVLGLRGVVKSVATDRYNGTTPINNSTFNMKGRRIIEINGAPDVQLIDIAGSVIWNDNDNVKNYRPASFRVNLYRDGVFVGSTDVDSFGSGVFTFPGQPKTNNAGVDCVYTVSAPTVLNEYTTTISGTTITNTLKRIYITTIFYNVTTGEQTTESQVAFYGDTITLTARVIPGTILVPGVPSSHTFTNITADREHIFYYQNV